jgi:hypothetical protein
MTKSLMISYILSQAKFLIIGVNQIDLEKMSYRQIKSFYNNINKYKEAN